MEKPSCAKMNELRIEHLYISHGKQVVVHDFCLSVCSGSIIGILGPNGAGKTSLLRGLAGMATIQTGRVMIDGITIDCSTPRAALSNGIVLVPEQRELFQGMTVWQNLALGAYFHFSNGIKEYLPLTGNLRRYISERIDDAIIVFPDLRDKLTDPLHTLSGGQQQMVTVARAIISQARVLLLDEPSTGMAPVLVEKLLGYAQQLARQGMTIFLVEQKPAAAIAVADRLFLVKQGHLVNELNPSEMTSDKIAGLYLNR